MTVDIGRHQAGSDGRAEQEVIDAQTSISAKGIPKIIPERVDAFIGMELA